MWLPMLTSSPFPLLLLSVGDAAVRRRVPSPAGRAATAREVARINAELGRFVSLKPPRTAAR